MLKRILIILILLLMLTLPLSTVAQEEGLYVDAAQELGEISPYVYGANYGPLSTVPAALISEAQQSGITFLRFPGGHWGDIYDIQPYHIEDLMRTARLIGAEPSIQVRLLDGTPEAAADLVRYTNIEHDYNIRYWYIGNEPNLFDDYTTEDLNVQWRAIAEAMLAVDPDIILIGPGLSQYNGTPQVDPHDSEGRDWLREFLLANGDLVDVVAVHRYPFPRNMGTEPTTIDDLRRNTAEWDNILPAMRAVIAETTGRDLPVAITEVNSHWSPSLGGEASLDSHYNAVWWADVLGRLIQHDAFIVGFFDLQSYNQRGGFGILGVGAVRPTYYVYQLYQKFGQTHLFANSSVEGVSVYAARRDDGVVTLIVVNLSDEALDVSLRIDGFAGEVASVWRLDVEHNADEIDPVAFSGEMMLPLTPQSVTLYVFE